MLLSAVLKELAIKPMDGELWKQTLESWRETATITSDTWSELIALVTTVASGTLIPPDDMFMAAAALELARSHRDHASLPEHISNDYARMLVSLTLLAECAIKDDLSREVRGAFSFLLVVKGLPVYALAMTEYTELELGEFILPG